MTRPDPDPADRPDEATRRPDPDIAGDPACWLNRVCPECGRFAENAGADPERCPSCGAELDPR